MLQFNRWRIWSFSALFCVTFRCTCRSVTSAYISMPASNFNLLPIHNFPTEMQCRRDFESGILFECGQCWSDSGMYEGFSGIGEKTSMKHLRSLGCRLKRHIWNGSSKPKRASQRLFLCNHDKSLFSAILRTPLKRGGEAVWYTKLRGAEMVTKNRIFFLSSTCAVLPSSNRILY